jgi:hypothetical protein
VAVAAFVLVTALAMSPPEPMVRDRAASVTGLELMAAGHEDDGAGRARPFFASGSPLGLVVEAHGSDVPALVEVEWRDHSGRAIDISRAALAGSGPATIRLAPRFAALESGKYHAVILIDGDPVDMPHFHGR